MRMPTVLGAILVLISAQSSGSSSARLVGCPTPAAIAEAIAKIQKSNWREVSVARVATIWPAHFDELKCESEKPCRLLVSKSRVISGHCECCETFQFDLEQNKDESQGEWLNNIIIHYTTSKKREAIDAAKAVAKSAGLPEAKITTVGRDSVQRYEWTDSGRVRQGYVAELRLTSLGTHWELYFSLSAYPI